MRRHHKLLNQSDPTDLGADRDPIDATKSDEVPPPGGAKSDDDRLPWVSVGVLLAVTMSEGIGACALFPFVPYMVEDFGLPADDVGFYAGLLGSAYNLAQFASGVQWGRASDVWGRKPVLLVGLVSQAVTMVLFGLSSSLRQAMLWRCMGGLLNGNGPVGRAVMREITTESTRTRGFSLLGTAHGMGFVIGPAMGGMLSRPAALFPELLRGTVLDRYPYLLPCAASTLGCYFALACLCCLPETRPPRGGLVSGVAKGSQPGVELTNAADESGGQQEPGPAEKAQSCWALVSRGARQLVGMDAPISAGVMFTIYVQFLLHFIVTAMQELFPLFCANSAHGLGLSPAEVGSSMAPLGISMLIWPLAFPYVDKRIGTLACFRMGVSLFLLVQMLIPALKLGQRYSPDALWWGLAAVSVLRGVAGVSTFTSISVLMNNLLEGDIGLVNGFASSITALSRALAPTLMGSLFAIASMHELPFPLDFHLPFYVLSLLCALTLVLSGKFNRARSDPLGIGCSFWRGRGRFAALPAQTASAAVTDEMPAAVTWTENQQQHIIKPSSV